MPIPLILPARRRQARRRTPTYDEVVARARRKLCGRVIEIPEDLLFPNRRRLPPRIGRQPGAQGVVASVSEGGSVCVVLEWGERRYFGVSLLLERCRVVS
uniref:Uncharacterized protein n=1 Tax=Thermogemmatispora argillosa TaxID=2045280 RepID=A0A455T3M7_9CHLR|nr:hypothetical protein KTA_33460 [Thermogemmatispora argillosa]